MYVSCQRAIYEYIIVLSIGLGLFYFITHPSNTRTQNFMASHDKYTRNYVDHNDVQFML